MTSSTPGELAIASTTSSIIGLNTHSSFVWLSGSTVFLLPYSSIEEYLLPQADSFILVQQQQFLYWRSQMIPFYQTSELLKYNHPRLAANHSQLQPGTTTNVFAIDLGQRIVALESAIDRLMTQKELAIALPTSAIAPPSYIYGCTLLDNNRLVLVIDAVALLEQHICSDC